MSKLRYYFDTSTLKMVYYSLIYTFVQYCISAWFGGASCRLRPIICMQKRIVSYVCCVPALTTAISLCLITCVLKIYEMFNLKVCKQMLNTYRGFEVDHSCFTPVNMAHTHNTKHSKIIFF